MLVRHALPIRREMVLGPADPELSSEHLDAIYASPLLRAYQTARVVNAPMGLFQESC